MPEPHHRRLRRAGHLPFCSYVHLHGDNEFGIGIDGNGPYQDPESRRRALRLRRGDDGARLRTGQRPTLLSHAAQSDSRVREHAGDAEVAGRAGDILFMM